MTTASAPEQPAILQLTEKTAANLQELIYGLRDSIEHHHAAANQTSDEYVAQTLRSIANRREEILRSIEHFVNLAVMKCDESSTFMGQMRSIWVAFRTALNGGNASIALLEAERAEQKLLSKFEEILPEISNSPINEELLRFFHEVKSGHDVICSLQHALESK